MNIFFVGINSKPIVNIIPSCETLNLRNREFQIVSFQNGYFRRSVSYTHLDVYKRQVLRLLFLISVYFVIFFDIIENVRIFFKYHKEYEALHKVHKYFYSKTLRFIKFYVSFFLFLCTLRFSLRTL